MTKLRKVAPEQAREMAKIAVIDFLDRKRHDLSDDLRELDRRIMQEGYNPFISYSDVLAEEKLADIDEPDDDEIDATPQPPDREFNGKETAAWAIWEWAQTQPHPFTIEDVSAALDRHYETLRGAFVTLEKRNCLQRVGKQPQTTTGGQPWVLWEAVKLEVAA